MTIVSTAHPNHNPEPLTISARRLEDKVVFITGASAGIGDAAARLFAAEGAKVAVASRRGELLERLVSDIGGDGGEALALEVDVTDEASVAEAVAATVRRFGRLDGALNNAGLIGAGTAVTEIDSAYFRQVLDVNLTGVFHGMKHQIPAMLEAGGGAIVNVSSVGGVIGMPNLADYVASKWGVVGITKGVALEFADRGVRVNGIAPASTKTEMYDTWLPSAEAQAAVAAFSPMNQIALPDDMARAALFLLSDESRWINGIVMSIDGGQSVGCF